MCAAIGDAFCDRWLVLLHIPPEGDQLLVETEVFPKQQERLAYTKIHLNPTTKNTGRSLEKGLPPSSGSFSIEV